MLRFWALLRVKGALRGFPAVTRLTVHRRRQFWRARNYFYCSSDLEGCCRFSRVAQALGELRSSCAQKTIQKHEG
eukprot:7171875-Pyramimonas_sp.AAC.1